MATKFHDYDLRKAFLVLIEIIIMHTDSNYHNFAKFKVRYFIATLHRSL